MWDFVLRNFAAESEDSAKIGTASLVGITYSRPLKSKNINIKKS